MSSYYCIAGQSHISKHRLQDGQAFILKGQPSSLSMVHPALPVSVRTGWAHASLKPCQVITDDLPACKDIEPEHRNPI